MRLYHIQNFRTTRAICSENSLHRSVMTLWIPTGGLALFWPVAGGVSAQACGSQLSSDPGNAFLLEEQGSDPCYCGGFTDLLP